MARRIVCFSVTIHATGERTYNDGFMAPGVDECPRGTYTTYAVPLFALLRSSAASLPVADRDRRVMAWAERYTY